MFVFGTGYVGRYVSDRLRKGGGCYPANPLSELAKARLSAEKGWLKLTHSLGVPIYIFRLGGIYGPGRSALDTIIKQESLSKAQRIRESKQYTARIHVADIYQAIEASFNIQSSRKIYNIVDDNPAPRDEVFAFARASIEARWPGQQKEVSPGGVSDLTP
ncbi:hypothetical protein QJS10_CPA01g01230 [Acorus calamus]|uniref:NAD-dependent epimerase/dehydratase domain-containing protein n=1 Tax=Acorus calamus TaxID=4465 RepID=A0AAV9FGM5_ACOCL|nr:hypothetical protein QJS10_CPA01g01230 [Acorus calamus]